MPTQHGDCDDDPVDTENRSAEDEGDETGESQEGDGEDEDEHEDEDEDEAEDDDSIDFSLSLPYKGFPESPRSLLCWASWPMWLCISSRENKYQGTTKPSRCRL